MVNIRTTQDLQLKQCYRKQGLYLTYITSGNTSILAGVAKITPRSNAFNVKQKK